MSKQNEDQKYKHTYTRYWRSAALTRDDIRIWQNEIEKYLLSAAEHVADCFGPYYPEVGGSLIHIDRYNNGSSLLDGSDVSEQQIQEIMQRLLRAT